MHTLEAGKKFKAITGITPIIDIALSMVSNKPIMDIFVLDNELMKHDLEYDNIKCTYKGKPNYSMSEYIEEKWGQKALLYCTIMCELIPKPKTDALQPI